MISEDRYQECVSSVDRGRFGVTPSFALRPEVVLFVDLRLPFGWWGVAIGTIQWAHWTTPSMSAGIYLALTEATKYVPITKPTGKTVATWPIECDVPRGQGGERDDPAWVASFVE